MEEGYPLVPKRSGCFLHYLDQEGHKVSRAEFEQNLYEKLGDPRFIADIGPLVVADSGFNSAPNRHPKPSLTTERV